MNEDALAECLRLACAHGVGAGAHGVGAGGLVLVECNCIICNDTGCGIGQWLV